MPSETALVQRKSNEKQWCEKTNKQKTKQNLHTQPKLPVSHYVQSLTIFKIAKNTK